MTTSTTRTGRFTKDPDSTLDYGNDWSAWLTDAGDDTIATSVWIVPDGITKASDSHTTTTTTIWLTGGTLGTRYNVVNRITTTQGRTEDRTLRIGITEH